MGNTPIEWTEKTWNPVTGCSPISPGCDHCYAARMAKRLAGRSGYPPAPQQFDVTCHPDRLAEPLHWNKPSMIFVCSMGDLFHDDVPDEFIDQVMTTIARCRCCGYDHTFQILTKRPQRMLEYLTADGLMMRWRKIRLDMKDYTGLVRELAEDSFPDGYPGMADGNGPLWPLPNLWLGVTAEDQQRADARIPLLLQCPAAVRFVSCEPLLGLVSLTGKGILPACGDHPDLEGYMVGKDDGKSPLDPTRAGALSKSGIHWIIAGGETGPGARPMNPKWARSLRDQCKAAGVAYFFKQWGEYIPEEQNQPGAHQYCALHNPVPDGGFFTFPDGRKMHRVGKKRAGHLLDGVEHRGYPDFGLRTSDAAGGCQ